MAGEEGGERGGCGRFDGEAEVLPEAVAGGDDVVVRDQYRADGRGLQDGEGDLTGPGGAQRGLVYRVHCGVDGSAGDEGVVQGAAADGFDGDDGTAATGEDGAGGQPATADGHHQSVHIGHLGDHLERAGALTGHHEGIV